MLVELAEPLPIIRFDVRLPQSTAKRSHRDFRFLKNNHRIDNITNSANEFDVASFLGVSAKPMDSRRRLISRKGCGSSRANLNLNGSKLWQARGIRRLKVKLQRFF